MRTPLKLLAFSGSANRPSKTRNLVETVVDRLSARIDITSSIHDLADFKDAGWGYDRRNLAAPARGILEAMEDADVLVVGSPVYKGSYSGLFKHVFDLVGPDSLLGKPVLLCASGGGYRHALVVEHQLRPLFGFFGALTVPIAVYASERDFVDGRLADAAVLDRIDLAVTGLVQILQPASRFHGAAETLQLAAS